MGIGKNLITTEQDLERSKGPDPTEARKKLLLLAQAYKAGGPSAMRKLYSELNAKTDGESKPFDVSGLL